MNKLILDSEPEAVEYVKWSSSYSVGIKLIDEQHKGLLQFVNDIFNHATGNQWEELAFFKDAIRQAATYVKIHFATEERYMKATKYPGYIEHKKEHEAFIVNVLKSAKDYEAGKRLTLMHFGHYLKDWVLSHIALMDKKYSEYYRGIATRKADGKLSITMSDVEEIEELQEIQED